MSSGLSPDNDVQITGATDNTNIGNDGTYLHVVTKDGNNPSANPACPVVSNKLRYEVDRTTVNLTASYQTIWSYTGSGKFSGIAVEFESTLTVVKFTVDTTNVIFEFTLADLAATSSTKEFSVGSLSTNVAGKLLIFTPGPELCPMRYTTNIKLEAKEATGKKKFGYVVGLTKET